MAALISSGQMASVSGMAVLAITAPVIPQRAGISPMRPLDLLVFWTAMGLLFSGIARVRGALGKIEGDRQLTAADRELAERAAQGVVLVALVMLLMLSNLLFTSLWGTGLFRNWGTMRLYERSFGWVLMIPLGIAIALELPLWRSASRLEQASAGAVPQPRFHLALAVLMGNFGLAWFFSLSHRVFLVVAVAVGWCGGILMLIAALAFLAWANSLRVLERPPE